MDDILAKVHTLTDLELATLLCLIAREHCLISTHPSSIDDLAAELSLVASKTFGLAASIISCHKHMTLDEFATGLLVPCPTSSPSVNTRSVSPYRPRHYEHQGQTSSTAGPSSAAAAAAAAAAGGGGGGGVGGGGGYFLSAGVSSSPRHNPSMSPPVMSASQPPRIANIILAKNLHLTPRVVQIQALELLRTRRIFTRTSVQTAPKQFLFIALVGANSGGEARVTPHLNDFFYIGHWHDPDEDGFPHLEGELDEDGIRNDDASNNGDNNDADGRSISSLSTTSVLVKHPSHSSTQNQQGPDQAASRQSSRRRWLSRSNSSMISTVSSTNLPPPLQRHPSLLTPSSDPEASSPTPLLTPTDISQLSLASTSAYISPAVLRTTSTIVALPS